MNQTALAERYNSIPYFSFSKTFSKLADCDLDHLSGEYRAEFLGPKWFRLLAGPALGLVGLPNWWGKEFTGTSTAHNLIIRSGEKTRTLKATMKTRKSIFDTRNTVTMSYPKNYRLPWRFVINEFRHVEDDCILGMSRIDLPLLRRISSPFLLYRTPLDK